MKFPSVLVALLVVAPSWAAFGQGVPSAAAVGAERHGSRLSFAVQEYDFGKVAAGTKVKHNFLFTNTGDQTLVITQVSPGCHCTTVGDWSKAHDIAPGKTGEIPIQFDSGSFRGTVHKTILVVSNDKLAPRQTILLTGTIWRAFEIQPPMARIDVPPDETSNITTVVRIISQASEPVTLSDPVSQSERFTAKLLTTNAAKEFELAISAVPPFSPGPTVGTVTVKTSLPSTPDVQVTVIAAVAPAVVISPLQIPLPPRLVHGMTNVIRIMDNGKKSLMVTNPKINDSRVNLKMKETTPGRDFEIMAVFPPNYQISPGSQIRITAQTDNASYHNIIVPVLQFPPYRSMSLPQFRHKPLSQNPVPPSMAAHP